ncbi:hypothetical protein ES703_40715 [subsurface metagenome]
MRDERIGMDIIIKGEKYPLMSWYTTIDVDKKRLWCHARLPDTGKEPVSSVSFFISITEFEKSTIENLKRAGITVNEHIT